MGTLVAEGAWVAGAVGVGAVGIGAVGGVMPERGFAVYRRLLGFRVHPVAEIEVILPNLNSRFSGVTAATVAVVPHQQAGVGLAQVGYPLALDIPRLSWWQLFKLTAKPLPSGRPRIFHTRRNIEMVAGLLLKHVFRRRLHLLFTSVAQRHHTWFTRFLYHRMDTVISPSPRSASFLRCPVKAIVPHGVDTVNYFPAEDRAKAWAEGGVSGKYGIGIFGRVRPQKGLQEFVDALCEVLPRHPDFTAIIVGETTPKFAAFVNRLKEKIRECGLESRFCWLGKLPFKDIPLWFRRVSLVAAVSHNEGFGLTCLEAMASGTPVIGTRTGAFDMVIRDGTDGLLVPCKDTAALAAAFERLLADPANLEVMGRAARQR
ncbi:MAG: glycosyltransferase family 4 protein, partial [Puniceicoccales bacterium]|nr:glycosyltransferase family 4 protein [Puniceicoccales bacterium]